MSSTRSKILDKNKVFFGLIHYILSEQKNVNWLIKSSLIDITGVNSTLVQKPYKTESILNDVVDFVKEIKPYHTQFSYYFEQYETANEICNVAKNDWLQQTIKMRFDAIKSTPDINKIFYEVVNKLPINTDEKIDNYNINGLTVFNKEDNKFYIRNYTKVGRRKTWIWKESDEKITDDGSYYTSADSKMFKYNLTEDDDSTLIEFTNDDIDEFIHRHMANRLFYMKYWVRKSDKDGSGDWVNGGIKVFNEIKKELNANFKGLTINGGVFDIGNFGYDIFNYDTVDYDSPTVVYDYYFVDYFENNLKKTSSEFTFVNDYDINDSKYYQKSFVKSGEHKFTFNLYSFNNIHVYKVSNTGDVTEYLDYDISTDKNVNYIDIFSSLNDKEKIYILSFNNNDLNGSTGYGDVNYAYVIEASSFTNSNSEILHREIVYLDTSTTYELRIPIIEVNSSDKIAVQKETKLGIGKPLSNADFTYSDGYIIIDNEDGTVLDTYNHIIMTQFDYKYLYDKVYMWEDRYGRSNNIVNLDGDKFLRSRYEEDRPSEKIVSYPQTSFFAYSNENDVVYGEDNEIISKTEKNPKTIYRNDYKNVLSYINTSIKTEISSEPELDENNMIKKLYVKNNFGKKSGKILINSEIIEYKESTPIYNTGDNLIMEYELSGLSRGVDGSTVNAGQLPKYEPHKLNIEVGDVVYPYEEDKWVNKKLDYLYKSYNIKDSSIRKYNCPSGYNLYSKLIGETKDIDTNNYIYVNLLSKINLLEDVTKTSEVIKIDSPNIISGLVTTPSGNKMQIRQALINGNAGDEYTNDSDYYYLKINDDVVKFKTITKISNFEYDLSDIILPEKYDNYKDDKVIYKNSEEYPNATFIYSSYPTEVSYSIEIKEGGDFVYDIVSDYYDEYDYYDENIKYVQMESINKSVGTVDLYKIINDEDVYTINHIIDKLTGETIRKESLFGKIVDGYVYKNNGEIYAKIDDDKFKSIEIIATIDDSVDLYKGESLLIKVLN